MAHPDWLKRYYRSPEWTFRKALYYRVYKRQCEACGSWKRVALHHMEYQGPWGDLRNPADWGKEPDEVLTPLCYSNWWRTGCHNNVHRIERNHSDLRAATMAVVQAGQRRRHLMSRLGLRRGDQRSRA